MGLFIRRYRGRENLTSVAKLSLICFLSYIGISFVDTIWALHLEDLFGNLSVISFFSAGLSIISFLAYFFLIPLIERRSKSSLFIGSIFIISVCYFLFAFVKNLWFFSIIAIFITIVVALKITSFGIIVKDKSNPKLLSRNEGLVWTFMNLAWVFGPLIAGLIANFYGIGVVFVFAGVFMILATIYFYFAKIVVINKNRKLDDGFLKNFRDFFKDRRRLDAYILGGAVNLWMVLLYLYMPLIIIMNGLQDRHVGYFLFFVALPLIFLEYKMSSMAGKVGFKRMFGVAFLFLSLVSLTCFFVNNIWIILGLLVFSSIGQAMIEPTTEAYFFDILKSKSDEDRFYGPYNTTIDANHFVGKMLSGIFLLLFPIKSLFLFFSVMMFFYFLYSFRVKDVKEISKKK